MADDLKELISRARAAQKIVEFWSQEQVDEMVAAAGWEVYREEAAVACARQAADETRMGRYEDKLLKHRKKTLGVLRDLKGVKTVGVIEEDPVRGLIKIAKPVGVIGAVTPVTNPTSTPAGNGLPALKTRNAIIFAPHPRAKGCCAMACEYMRKGLAKIGAPVDLIQYITDPTVEMSQQLMASVDLILATGGGAMVKAAYSSGTPSYGVGAGNAVIIVDESADIADAAKKVFLSKTFDNATSCSSDNSVVIQAGIYDQVMAALKGHGGYLCNAEEKSKLGKCMWPDGAHLNRDVVAQPPLKIAKLAGLDVPEGTTFLMVLGEKIGPEDMFSGEKLSPVLTVWKYNEFPEAIAYVRNITAFNGHGHSCGIHSFNDVHILELATQVHCSRIMVRQPQCYANTGDWVNGMPFTMSLGCGTWGGNTTTENIHYKHMMNVTWVSKPIPPVIPTDEEIFGGYWEKWGK